MGLVGKWLSLKTGKDVAASNCDTSSAYGGDASVRANANDESHSFVYW